MTTEASVPVLSPTFFEPGFNQAPFPLLEEIRALGPVVFNEVLDGYMITGYRDVARILGCSPSAADRALRLGQSTLRRRLRLVDGHQQRASSDLEPVAPQLRLGQRGVDGVFCGARLRAAVRDHNASTRHQRVPHVAQHEIRPRQFVISVRDQDGIHSAGDPRIIRIAMNDVQVA